jgi:hypothetical protein
MAQFKILSRHLAGGTDKNHEKPRLNIRSVGTYLNQGPHEYEGELLTTRPRSSAEHSALLKITKELVQRFMCLKKQY